VTVKSSITGQDIPWGMRPREFAKAYGLSEGAVYKGLREGAIPHVRLGDRFVILPHHFEALARPVVRR